MKRWIYDFFNLLYPELCVGCESVLTTGENLLCTSCRAHLPLTNFHKTSDEKMRELFYTRIDVQHVTSLFYYEKIGAVQQMIHQLKYRKKEEISSFIGSWLGQELIECDLFMDVDVVVPVPVHPKRLKKRGYNQVAGFGNELAQILNASYRDDILVKTKNTINQARLNQTQRSDESNNPYQLVGSLPQGTHVLIVDDVITTGTTLVLCARALLSISDIKISIATMAISV
ncbi:competence protein F homolog [Nonlabens ulvanivorans]|uniref:Competence protein F homolog n=1 Tax=Nonlabens ulvanivorans TaxID=906888 RepID=A0A090QA99_NONUL|nr:phosphoribosyltransferase family protein [Nonlabens ulvanivorans]GAK98708.1 competence protein F homolog [Nonlabens ulvanivorans]